MERQEGTQDPADVNLKLRLGLGRQEPPPPPSWRKGRPSPEVPLGRQEQERTPRPRLPGQASVSLQAHGSALTGQLLPPVHWALVRQGHSGGGSLSDTAHRRLSLRGGPKASSALLSPCAPLLSPTSLVSQQTGASPAQPSPKEQRRHGKALWECLILGLGQGARWEINEHHLGRHASSPAATTVG